MREQEWSLVSCVTCGSLVFEKVSENGTPTYRPLVERGSEIDEEKIAIPGVRPKYKPVFSGHTPDGTLITVYTHVDRETEVYLDPGDGALVNLGGAEVYTRFDPAIGKYHIQINSLVWSGEAVGTKWDMLEAQSR